MSDKSTGSGNTDGSSNLVSGIVKLFKEKGRRPGSSARHPGLYPPSSNHDVELGELHNQDVQENGGGQGLGGDQLNNVRDQQDVGNQRSNVRDQDNVQNEVENAISKQREMKRYQPFSLAAFAGVLTVVFFSLSSNTKLQDYVKYGITGSFIGMFGLSVLTIAAAYASDTGMKEDEAPAQPPAEEGSLGCNPGATISFVCCSLALLVMYIVDITIIILHSYFHPDGEKPDAALRLRNILIPVAIVTDFLIGLLWVNVWRRPKCIYSWPMMMWIRASCWKICGGVYAKFRCVSRAEPAVRPADGNLQ